MSSPAALDVTFVQLLPKGTEQLFTKLMNIKGIPKSEHANYLHAYRKAKEEDDKYRKAQRATKK